jgi:glycosyltransferase A (GT-A) superfamily protein (DUF2064 family)
VRLAAVVLATAPEAPGVLEGLAPALGADARAALQATLIRRAAAWAVEAAGGPGAATVAVLPASGAEDVAALVPPGVRVEAQTGDHLGERIAAAARAAFDRHGGPVLIAGIGVPRLGPAHIAAVRADLDAGAEASFGPNMDGGWYLAALAAPRLELFDLAGEVWEGPVVMARTLEVAQRLGLEIGLLRMERRLETVADAAAFLADPLTPADVAGGLAALA